MPKRSTSSAMAFNDLLFNVLIGFVMLFVIAFLLINPIAKNHDIPAKAEYMIILEWDNDSADDVDLWIQRDNSTPVGFSNKVNAPLHLDRDDLGWSNDSVMIDGQPVLIRSNIETITIRGNVPGDYYVAIHYYSKKQDNVSWTVTMMQLNPFHQVYSVTGTLSSKGETTRLPAFTIEKDGSIKEGWAHKRNVVPTRGLDPG